MAANKRKKRKFSTVGRNKRIRKDPIRQQPVIDLKQLESRCREKPDDIATAINLADGYARRNCEKKIVELLEPFESTIQSTPSAANASKYWRLMALGYAHLHRLVEAENIVKRSLENDPEAPDLHYVRTFLKLGLREFDTAIESGNQYLETIRKLVVAEETSDVIASTSEHIAQVYNFIGAAFQNKKNFEEAHSYFTEAIRADPGGHLPYLNLCKLFKQKGKSKEAITLLEKALKNCRQVEELRMLSSLFKKRSTVSACMIVKDEEQLLGDCLASIRDWVDEIIVVDTGSTDKTVEIAKSYGARVFHQPWEGDFSKHRNFSIEKSEKDWIFIIDADERIYEEDLPQLESIMSDSNFEAISLHVVNVYGEREARKTFLRSVRLFRRKLNLRYEGIVHNSLLIPDDTHTALTHVRLKHLGYDLSPEKMKKKFKRSISLLEKQLEDNPDNTFALFNYAQLMRAEDSEFKKENAPAVLKAAHRVVQLTDPSVNTERHLHLMCLDQIAWTHFYLKEYDKAKEYCQRALVIKPDYLDQILLHGFIYSELKDFDPAIKHLNKYLEVQAAYDDNKEADSLILSHPASRDAAYYNLALIYQLKGDPAAAQKNYEKTLETNNGFLTASSNLGLLMMADNNVEEAEKLFRQQIELSQTTKEAVLGLAYISHNRGQIEKAGEYFDLALKEFPKDITVLLKCGCFNLEHGKPETAKSHFNEAAGLENAPNDVEYQIAGIYFKCGSIEEAAEFYDRALKQKPPTSELHNDLGNCYYRLGKLDQAEKQYQQALEQPNVTPAAYRNLGLTRARLDKPKEAIILLEKYLDATAEEDLTVISLLADLLRRIGEYEVAISQYERALRISPETTELLLGLSECYLLMGHTDSAIVGFQKALEIQPQCDHALERLRQLAQTAPNI